jgi:hypothetical protein
MVNTKLCVLGLICSSAFVQSNVISPNYSDNPLQLSLKEAAVMKVANQKPSKFLQRLLSSTN